MTDKVTAAIEQLNGMLEWDYFYISDDDKPLLRAMVEMLKQTKEAADDLYIKEHVNKVHIFAEALLDLLPEETKDNG